MTRPAEDWKILAVNAQQLCDRQGLLAVSGIKLVLPEEAFLATNPLKVPFFQVVRSSCTSASSEVGSSRSVTGGG